MGGRLVAEFATRPLPGSRRLDSTHPTHERTLVLCDELLVGGFGKTLF
jgi:hypothetical protein